MKFLSSLAVCVPLAALTIYHLHDLPTAYDLSRTCEVYNVPKLTGVTGFDTTLCVITTVFSHAFRNPLGYDVTWLLLGFFGLVLTLFALEGARARSNRLLACFSLWGMISNFGGMSVVLFLFWIPALYYSSNNESSNVKSFHISPSRANAVLLAILVGYASPTAAMLLTDSLQMQKWAAMIWQFAPLWIHPLYLGLTYLMASCLDDPSADMRMTLEAREKLKVADSRNSVQRVYMIVGLINAMIYYVMYIRLKMKGMLNLETLINLYHLYNGQLTGVTTEQMGQIVATHVFAIDLLVCYSAIVVWAFFEDGIKGVLLTLIASIFVGPGGGAALYLVYREERLQDTALLPRSTTTAVATPATPAATPKKKN
ncbi:hypothetical protein BDB00DRAFT_825399 [Zychaea mexicana]|uniref:uncharacterized protein n=1 Tax=Zychaea mexicana TaxID=64656 RepID=UPI0022FEAF38|nr:uncharacterized protein BDB00DRAFT_825399 [Zychaea mexicana]KAI9492956.1 hypothetical protein BDB00DRAFT_825399 [Zychaea mexicana]